MPQRYGPDGQRLWNDKTPEEFTEQDVRQFLAETNDLLYIKEGTNMATATQTQAAAPTRDAGSVSVEARVYLVLRGYAPPTRDLLQRTE